MSRDNHKGFPETVYGLSPLGGNAIEGSEVKGVPLVYDARVGAYISEQAVEELNDHDAGDELRLHDEDEQAFRKNAGFIKL